VCKASIAAVVLALGIVSLVQESTNAMVGPPAGLRPAFRLSKRSHYVKVSR
jgi:hypothetical protein